MKIKVQTLAGDKMATAVMRRKRQKIEMVSWRGEKHGGGFGPRVIFFLRVLSSELLLFSLNSDLFSEFFSRINHFSQNSNVALSRIPTFSTIFLRISKNVHRIPTFFWHFTEFQFGSLQNSDFYQIFFLKIQIFSLKCFRIQTSFLPFFLQNTLFLISYISDFFRTYSDISQNSSQLCGPCPPP